ncbi:MAG: polyprenyl synthetase family protein [Bacteroidaceae bacterium]|nr:polyprenyl synthetase family protein [Bacteroidaceae bacterium]
MLNLICRPITEELAAYKQLFDETLNHNDPFMGQALAYIRNRSGKMMRPILTLLIAKELGQVEKSAYHCAISLELLHTASLVHDDVVDEAKQRRGQPSVNDTYDNKVAVLLGDYLLSLSLLQASLGGSNEAVNTIAQLGGTLAEGEIYQLTNITREEVSEEHYFHIIERKTAALFTACTRLGALSGRANQEFITVAERIGTIIGICFQIRDDIFDYYTEDIGKPTGNDMREGKITLPAIYAICNNPTPHVLSLVKKVKQGEATPQEIEEIIEFTKCNGGIEYAQEKMNELKQEAIKLLEHFKNTEIKEALKLYIEYVVDRKI